jgi:hypothetical protein
LFERHPTRKSQYSTALSNTIAHRTQQRNNICLFLLARHTLVLPSSCTLGPRGSLLPDHANTLSSLIGNTTALLLTWKLPFSSSACCCLASIAGGGGGGRAP